MFVPIHVGNTSSFEITLEMSVSHQSNEFNLEAVSSLGIALSGLFSEEVSLS